MASGIITSGIGQRSDGGSLALHFKQQNENKRKKIKIYKQLAKIKKRKS